MKHAGNDISEPLITSKHIMPNKEYQDWVLQNYSKSQNLSINESNVCLLIASPDKIGSANFKFTSKSGIWRSYIVKFLKTKKTSYLK